MVEDEAIRKRNGECMLLDMREVGGKVCRSTTKPSLSPDLVRTVVGTAGVTTAWVVCRGRVGAGEDRCPSRVVIIIVNVRGL
jgi:hypothetical protein